MKKYNGEQVYEFKELSNSARDFAVDYLLNSGPFVAEIQQTFQENTKLFDKYQEILSLKLPGAILHSSFLDNLKVTILEIEWWNKEGYGINLFLNDFSNIKSKLIEELGEKGLELTIKEFFEDASIFFEKNYGNDTHVDILNTRYSSTYNLPSTYLIIEKAIINSTNIVYNQILELEDEMTTALNMELINIKEKSFKDEIIIGTKYLYYKDGMPAVNFDSEELEND